MPGVDGNKMLVGFMKTVGLAIVISIFTGLFLSFIFLKEKTIFSSWFVDVYKPTKGFVIEKPPVRLIFFGESSQSANPDNLSKIINSLNEVEYQNYKFNSKIDVNFVSSLKGDRQRDAGKTVDVNVKATSGVGELLQEVAPSLTNKK
jgi:hypothetical protein